MNDAQATRFLNFLRTQMEIIEDDDYFRDESFEVKVELEISDTPHFYEWDGSQFRKTNSLI